MNRLIFCLLVLVSFVDSCVLTEKSIKTKNSSPAKLIEKIPIYRCEPTAGQDEVVLMLEFEHVYDEGPSKAIVEDWPINKLRLDCHPTSQQLFTTATEGHKKYLMRTWCNGFKKAEGNTRESIIAEITEKIAREHSEL